MSAGVDGEERGARRWRERTEQGGGVREGEEDEEMEKTVRVKASLCREGGGGRRQKRCVWELTCKRHVEGNVSR